MSSNNSVNSKVYKFEQENKESPKISFDPRDLEMSEDKANKHNLKTTAEVFVPKKFLKAKTFNFDGTDQPKTPVNQSQAYNPILEEYKLTKFAAENNQTATEQPFKTNININFINNFSLTVEPALATGIFTSNDANAFSSSTKNLETFILSNFEKSLSSQANINKLQSFVKSNNEFLNYSLFPLVFI